MVIIPTGCIEGKALWGVINNFEVTLMLSLVLVVQYIAIPCFTSELLNAKPI